MLNCHHRYQCRDKMSYINYMHCPMVFQSKSVISNTGISLKNNERVNLSIYFYNNADEF